MGSSIRRLAALALYLPALCLAGALPAKQIPADAKWVLHLDMDAVAKSALWPAIQEKIDATPGAAAKLAEVETFAGMNLPEDLHSISLYGLSFEDDDAVVLLQAKANQQQLLNALQFNPAYTNEKYAGHEILSWDDKGKTKYGGFFGGGDDCRAEQGCRAVRL